MGRRFIFLSICATHSSREGFWLALFTTMFGATILPAMWDTWLARLRVHGYPSGKGTGFVGGKGGLEIFLDTKSIAAVIHCGEKTFELQGKSWYSVSFSLASWDSPSWHLYLSVSMKWYIRKESFISTSQPHFQKQKVVVFRVFFHLESRRI